MRTRTSPLVALVAVAFGMLSTAAAWACTGLASIATDPKSGLVGQPVRVYGDVFREGAVEIRWNSSEGPVLAESSGPGFTARITIPEAGPGEHIVMAVQRAEDGSIARKASAVFTVTSPAAVVPAAAVAPARPAPAVDAATTSDPAVSPSAPSAAMGDLWSGLRYDRSSLPSLEGNPQPEPVDGAGSAAGALAVALAVTASGAMLALRGRSPRLSRETVS